MDEFWLLWAGQNARLAKRITVDKIIQDLLGLGRVPNSNKVIFNGLKMPKSVKLC